MNSEQLKQALLGLLGSSGPLVAFFVQVLGLPSEKVAATLNMIAAATPILWLGIQLYRSRVAGLTATVASLPPEAVRAALPQVPDDAKVRIAEAVPGVATVVIKDAANGVLSKLAESDAHPNIVSETQNAIDKEKGNAKIN